MTTIFERTITCPACGERFSVSAIGSCGFAGKDTDFRPQYWGMNPMPHFVHTCPSCLYSGGESHFQGPISEDVKRSLRRQRAAGGDVPSSGSRKYELAARCREWAGDGPLTVADLHLKASWCARFENDERFERLSQQRAVEWFERAFDQNAIEAEMVETITYLVGELYRRLGQFDRAVALLERTTEGGIGDLARKQLDLALDGDSRNTAIGR